MPLNSVSVSAYGRTCLQQLQLKPEHQFPGAKTCHSEASLWKLIGKLLKCLWPRLMHRLHPTPGSGRNMTQPYMELFK
ncbi:hypothetical protein ACLKA7_002628 [Drosophila subpalustris]